MSSSTLEGVRETETGRNTDTVVSFMFDRIKAFAYVKIRINSTL